MASLRKQLEDVIIAVIKATPAMMAYLRAVAPYNGELGKEKLDDVFEALRGRAPAVLVTTGDSKADTLNLKRTRAIENVDVDLFLISNNLRTREDRTRADGHIYQISEDLDRLLMGRESGIAGVGVLELDGKKVMVQVPDMCIWRVRYGVSMNATATNPEDSAPSLLELAGTIFQPPDDDIPIVGIHEVLAP